MTRRCSIAVMTGTFYGLEFLKIRVSAPVFTQRFPWLSERSIARVVSWIARDAFCKSIEWKAFEGVHSAHSRAVSAI